jgi:hypothetical protein
LSAGVALVCTVLVIVTGDIQARLMDSEQPMKMAAANLAECWRRWCLRTPPAPESGQPTAASRGEQGAGTLSSRRPFHARSASSPRLRFVAVGHALPAELAVFPQVRSLAAMPATGVGRKGARGRRGPAAAHDGGKAPCRGRLRRGASASQRRNTQRSVLSANPSVWKRGCQAAGLEVTNRCWFFRPCSRPARS